MNTTLLSTKKTGLVEGKFYQLNYPNGIFYKYEIWVNGSLHVNNSGKRRDVVCKDAKQSFELLINTYGKCKSQSDIDFVDRLPETIERMKFFIPEVK